MSKSLKILLVILIIEVLIAFTYTILNQFYLGKRLGEPISAPTVTAPAQTQIQPQIQPQTQATLQEAKIKDILTNPQNYQGKTVKISGKFYGRLPSPSISVTFPNKSCIASRSDYSIDDDTGIIYVNKANGSGLEPTTDIFGYDGPPIEVVLKGKVVLKTEKEIGMSAADTLCVFLDKPE